MAGPDRPPREHSVRCRNSHRLPRFNRPRPAAKIVLISERPTSSNRRSLLYFRYSFCGIPFPLSFSASCLLNWLTANVICTPFAVSYSTGGFMKFRMTLLAATVLAAPCVLPTLAQAQPVTGPYVAGGIGYNIESSSKGKNIVLDNQTSEAPGVTSVRIVTHNGWTGEGSVGYGFGDGFRVELEGDYFSNNFSKTNGVAQVTTSGKEEKYGLFANGFYDFDVGLPYLFPYLGAGIGYQDSNFNGYNAGP